MGCSITRLNIKATTQETEFHLLMRKRTLIEKRVANFYCAMLCIARTMPSQDVCRLSHAGILLKRLNISSNFFAPSGSTPF